MLQPSTGTGPSASPSPRRRRRWALLVSLCTVVLCLPEEAAATINCHKTCICASNIISCSKMNLTAIPTGLPLYTAVLDLSYNEILRLRSEWTAVKLPNLHSLLLGHNGLNFVSSEAFVCVKHLRYLDLSSNRLWHLEEFIFEPLVNLEVLLLYNNQITRIDHSAFVGMTNLQKLYLSQNQIARFPDELVREKSRLEKLTLLDVSSNRIKTLRTEELQVLPAWIKNGLYFHNNPLQCSCDLYALLAHWYIRRFHSAVDFKEDFTCVLPGPQKTQVGVFDLSGDAMNCSTFEEKAEEAYLEQTVTLGCDAKHRDAVKTWKVPGNAAVTPGSNRTARVLADGSLRVGPATVDDSGTYTCVAASEAVNETIYVVLKVFNFTMEGSGDTLNTGYTTLVGCLASVVLVLMYLYLTPCRCFCCPSKRKARGEDSIRSSMLSVTPTHGDPALKAELNRHVAFMDAKDLQGQNGKLNPTEGEDDEEEDEELDAEAGSLMKGKRKKSVAESISSVFSDTPMVV